MTYFAIAFRTVDDGWLVMAVCDSQEQAERWIAIRRRHFPHLSEDRFRVTPFTVDDEGTVRS